MGSAAEWLGAGRNRRSELSSFALRSGPKLLQKAAGLLRLQGGDMGTGTDFPTRNPRRAAGEPLRPGGFTQPSPSQPGLIPTTRSYLLPMCYFTLCKATPIVIL